MTKTIDIRFDDKTVQLIQSLVGQRFDRMRRDTFLLPSVYGLVCLFIGEKCYKLTNFVEVLDYYGTLEDVAVLHFKPEKQENIKSLQGNGEMSDSLICKRIREIRIVNENQRLYHNEVQTYDVYTVRGLIFVFEDDCEISFEKSIWFSELIHIEEGYDLIQKFDPTDEFVETWEGEYRGACSREVISLAK